MKKIHCEFPRAFRNSQHNEIREREKKKREKARVRAQMVNSNNTFLFITHCQATVILIS